MPTGYNELVGIELRADHTYTLIHQVMGHGIFGKDEGKWRYLDGVVELTIVVRGTPDGPHFLPQYCRKMRAVRSNGRLLLQSMEVPLVMAPQGPLMLVRTEE